MIYSYSPVRHLGNVVHPRRSKRKLLFMLNLVSYLDETGHGDDPALQYVGMAGFVAPCGVWEVFEEQWENTLRNAGFKDPFHMKDFAQHRGQFSCWADRSHELDRRKLFGRLVEIILETKAIPIGAIVSIPAFRSLTAAQQKSFGDPYYVAFQYCTKVAANQGLFKSHDEKVAMVFAYQQEFGTNAGGRAERFWHLLKHYEQYGSKMGTYTSSYPADLSPLQAADLFAYELSHEFENQVKRPSDGMRWGLKQILTLIPSPVPSITLLDRPELLRRVRDAKMDDQTGVEELLDYQIHEHISGMTKWMFERSGRDFSAIDRAIWDFIATTPVPTDVPLPDVTRYIREQIAKKSC